MQTLQAYGLVTSTFSDVSYTDMEPVDDNFIGVKYYIAEDVAVSISDNSHVDFLREQLDKRQETIEELFGILEYWKERCAALKVLP